MSNPTFPSSDFAGSLASFIGFAATKNYRSCRRAMRPVVGDTFITKRGGELLFAQVDWVDHEWIGFGRFKVKTGEALLFGKIAQKDWNKTVMKAFRIGCQFCPILHPEALSNFTSQISNPTH